MGEPDNNGNGDTKRRNGKEMTKHHVVPRSRGGGELDKNIIRIPDRYHSAWHVFFGNLTLRESIIFIRKIFGAKRENGKWKSRDLYNLQLEIQAETLKRGKKKKKK